MTDGIFDMSEVNKLAVDMSRASGTVGAKVAAIVRKSAADIERDAKIFAPVDTGNLRSSISTSVTGDGRNGDITADVGPTAEYGVYVEYGTSTQGPAAFVGPAFDRHAHLFETAIGIAGAEALF